LNTLRLIVALILLLTIQLILTNLTLTINVNAKTAPDVYIGVDMSYGDSVSEAKKLIDQVSPYTNVFILGCKGITYNTTKLDEACQYIVDKGLDFIIYRDTSLRNATWTEMANQKWKDHFLGYYAFDELGGWQIDMHEWRMVMQADNYSDAAKSFVNMSSWYLDRFSRFRNTSQFNLYTSDYALYWFDYENVYDTVFAELGWNYSRQLNIALCRGAADIHQKTWGTILTWTYTQPPYLESGQKLYEDMILSYNNGAKYIIVFDGNEGWTSSVLTQEHFDAIKRFWQYVKDNPRQITPASQRVAYVLPNDYGYGFRGPNDKIWGFWGPDDLTNKICNDINYLLSVNNERLDIIYDKGLSPGSTAGYRELFFWNQSIVQPTPATSNTFPSEPENTVAENQSQNALNNYVIMALLGVIIAAITVPTFYLRKQEYIVKFETTGLGPDFKGTPIIVDGLSYDKFGTAFWWKKGTQHTYEFKQRIIINSSKQYVIASISGEGFEKGSLKVSQSQNIVGNYRQVSIKK
jgi:hypothetical protein